MHPRQRTINAVVAAALACSAALFAQSPAPDIAYETNADLPSAD